MSPTSSNLTYLNHAAVRRNHWLPYLWHSSQKQTLLTQISICFNADNFDPKPNMLYCSDRSLSLSPLIWNEVISAKCPSSCRSNKNILFTSTCWSINGYQGMIQYLLNARAVAWRSHNLDLTTFLLQWGEGFLTKFYFWFWNKVAVVTTLWLLSSLHMSQYSINGHWVMDDQVLVAWHILNWIWNAPIVSAKYTCKFIAPLSLVPPESNQMEDSYVTTISRFKEAV
jgi:hypothetical protein